MMIYKKQLAEELIANGHELVTIKPNPRVEGKVAYVFNDSVALITHLLALGIRGVSMIDDFDIVVSLVKDGMLPFKIEGSTYFFTETKKLKNKLEKISQK